MITAVDHAYITMDEAILDGEPIIKGTRTPVRAVVELYRMGVSPEEIPAHMPHLDLAQIFDALSYYSGHQKEIDDHITANSLELPIAE